MVVWKVVTKVVTKVEMMGLQRVASMEMTMAVLLAAYLEKMKAVSMELQ